MPKTNRGGKAGQPVYTNPGTPITFGPAQTVQTQSGRTATFHPLTSAPAQTSSGGGGGVASFNPMTQAQAQQIHQAQQQAMQSLAKRDIMAVYAIKQYIRADTQANGKSRAQNLNQKLETGGKLDPTEKSMVKYMDRAMTPLGQDVTLYRGDHAITPQGSGLMQRLGIPNYQSMSPAQLQKALVGRTYTEKKYLSTSEVKNSSPFIGGSQAGGRAVLMNIKAPGSTKAVRGDAKQTEQILARGGNYKITGVRFTGATVHPAAGGSYRQIELDVEII